MSGGWTSRRRFWSEVAVIPVESGGWSVALDGKPVSTPGRNPLAAPVRAVADAAAEEFAAQGDEIDPLAMPVVRALNSAIDRVSPQIDAVRAEIAGYAETDLLCYRAPHPEALAERQAEAWDPLLDWARERYGASLVCAAGVMYAPQPPEAGARLAAAVAERDAYALTALHDLVALSGSLVIGLAVDEGGLAPDAAWTLSRIDEAWQIEQWGEDAEAAEAARAKALDFGRAARLSAMLRQR